jgi:hypothetical protein
VSLRKEGAIVQLRVESPAVKKRFICKSAAAKIRLYVCYNYSEIVTITVLKSVARIRLAQIENAY